MHFTGGLKLFRVDPQAHPDRVHASGILRVAHGISESNPSPAGGLCGR